ncbi:MAG: efflux transporter periplasmic adaptor subunit [Gammaproteobacteria bacterium 39-13]|nr:efflux RND transporter periplasmic adaptor subunit [Gammaproteobacteria bacterium]OJV93879.1 MAG: efflux transporter periplasmic adaptor subunit [Gammaproteobacteria bacterium 39-13]
MLKKLKLEIPEKYHRKSVIALIIIISLALMGITSRILSFRELKRTTKQQAIPIVATIKAMPGEMEEEIVLPGNVQAWHEATIFARTSGYIKKWMVDIGSRVKKGDLLAFIETPEVDAQLRQAEADLKTAIANNELAQSTAIRWRSLLTTNSVSKQEADEKISTAKASETIVKSTRANRDRLKELVGFKEVVAPFDGIITSRTTDIGSLIDAGSNVGLELFRIVQSNPLRVYVNVPQNYSSRITPKMDVTLRFAEHPGKSYQAKLRQTAKAIDPVTRTLLIELTVDNSKGELLPGGYTEVHLKLPSPEGSVRLPVNTLLFRAQGLQVATLPEDGKVVLKSVTIGRDFGTEVEISSGLKEGEIIILNPPDALETGQVVRVASSQQSTKQKASEKAS